jgi:predicted ribosomally synthesized peptide with SipW-like signal peptide
MNIRIALSSLSILTALALMGGATFAFFSDVGTSNNNVFAAGTFDLLLSDDTPETLQDDVVASFGGENMAPGDCTTSQQLRLRNSGTVAGDHVDITTTNSDSTIAPFLRLDTLDYDLGNVLANIDDVNLNGYKDLDDWEADPDGLQNLPLTNLGTDHTLDVVVCLDESATIGVEGLSDVVNLSATLRQQAHASE